jgi:hypothetical protein
MIFLKTTRMGGKNFEWNTKIQFYEGATKKMHKVGKEKMNLKSCIKYYVY